jgi:hypothetical protein
MNNDLTSGNFASVDFPDATEISLADYPIDSYSTTLNNCVIQHLNEIREKNPTSHSINQNINWKKRFREFILTKNNKLLEFLTTRLEKHPVLGPVEVLFAKFSKQTHTNRTIKDVVLDMSANVLETIDNSCVEKGWLPLDKYAEQTQYLMDQYKIITEKILDKEKLLKIKLVNLDSIQTKLNSLITLNQNEHYNSLMESMEKYMETTFDENSIEEDYNSIIEEYRRFLSIREIIRTIRTIESTEKEPLCSICFDDTIQYAFAPCGHTFCSTCTKKQVLNCSICRGHIREIVKIYFT